MRIETIIRKAFRLKAHFVKDVVEKEDHTLEVVIDRFEHRGLCCGTCGRQVRHTHGKMPAQRRWRDLSVRDWRLVLVYRPWRVVCPRCGVRVEKIPWAAPHQRVTHDLARAVAELARRLSWKETAEYFHLNWKTVAGIIKLAVERGRAARPWKALHVIGIDEVSRRKGHLYLTLVYDLERRRLVWVGRDRDRETMEAFFAWLGPRKARSIRVVCCDMWEIYIEAVGQYLSQAQIVFDRFHVVKHLSLAVDQVRRAMWRALAEKEKSAFKRTRWLWLKNPWNLTRKQSRRLSALCQRNMPIVRAYYLKEAFRKYWDYVSEGWARPYLQWWLWWASHSRLEPFKRFARMIRTHMEGILAWTRLHVSNGALEGMNNKVKAVSHRSYGFRKTDTYMTAIWHACGDLPLVLN
jgi:transposase